MEISFNVGTIFCYDCVKALGKFIGSINGVQGVKVDEGKVSVEYDPSKISEEKVAQIARDSIEKLGYKILD